MKDFLGEPLNIGDTVVTTPKNYRGLVKATITAFTPKQVRVVYMRSGREEEFLTPPDTMVKVV